MTTQEIADKVKTRIGEVLEQEVAHLTPDSKLHTSLEGFDSIRMYELVVDLEELFGIEFDELDPEMVETLGDLVAAIEEQLKDKK